MRSLARRRNALAVLALLLVFSLGATVAVFVAPQAAASGTTSTTTTATSGGTTTSGTTGSLPGFDPNSPAAHFFVINVTVNAASDHEIVGSSAFPNFTTGAVDNYYSMAHSHVDNSPFAEGTASPADTGPIGQTAAAGNTQQPQYADARWPGNSGKATYGSQGGPYATAEAGEYKATADASEASIALNGPPGFGAIALPKGLDARLRQALAAWKAQWQDRLHPGAKPTTPTVPIPRAPTVRTPIAPVPTPTATVAGVKAAPPVPVPVPAPSPVAPSPSVPSPSTPSPSTTSSPAVPTVPSPTVTGPLRSPASASPADGAWALQSSTTATLDSKTNALVTSGESSVGRVSLGGGQIVLEGIHVSASITNDGTTVANKVAVTVGSASIGGVPVTIDQDGVHVSGQGQALPYQQASDALNGALKQAGIQLYVVAPEIKTSSCDQTGTGSGGGTTTTSTSSTSTTSTDQSGTTGSCDQTGTTTTCDQTGTSTGTGPGTTTTTSTTTPTTPIPTPGSGSGTTTTTSPCDQSGMAGACDQTGASNGTSTGTTTTAATTTAPSSSSSYQSSTTTTPSWCSGTGTTTTPSSCGQTGTAAGTTTTTTPGDQPGMSTTTSPGGDQTGAPAGTTGSGQETVTATGLHVVFTQPVSQSGVPTQYAEHILGEVFLDSLAVPAPPLSSLGLSSSLTSASSSCGNGGHASGTGTPGGSTAGGSSSAGGSTSSGSFSPSGSASGSPSASGFGSSSQPASGSTGNSLPAAFAAALRKPLWLLLAYVLWQSLVIGTGASLWNWRRGGAS